MKDSYSARHIQVLKGIEHVKKRPSMYVGSTGPEGLHHLVYEVVDNSIDETLAGYCNTISVVIEKGNVIRVQDDGSGIDRENLPFVLNPFDAIAVEEALRIRGLGSNL